MHPYRAAKISATIGAALLLAVLVFRALALGFTISARDGQPQPETAEQPPVGSIQLVPGGAEIVFQQGNFDETLAQPGWYSMPVEGGPITRSGAPEPPDISPFQLLDGDISLQRSPESKAARISPRQEKATEAVLSPDGSALAFATMLEVDRMRLYIKPVDGDLIWMGEETAFFHLDWSADSDALAFLAVRQGASQVFSVRADGRDYRMLTSDAARKSLPRWSPDGKVIAYTAVWADEAARRDHPAAALAAPRVETAQPQEADVEAEIYSVDAGGAGARVLAAPHSVPQILDWVETDGESELLYTERLPGHPSTSFAYAVPQSGGLPRRVYPPVWLDGLECPPVFPAESDAPARLTVSNSGRVPLDLPLVMRAQGTAFGAELPDESLAQRIETVTLLPGEQRVLEWPVRAAEASVPRRGEPAALGRQTYVSVNTGPETVYPIQAVTCSAPNTAYGLPNLLLLWPTLALLVLGLLLCIPRLLQRKSRAGRLLWAAAPLVFLILAVIETRSYTGG